MMYYKNIYPLFNVFCECPLIFNLLSLYYLMTTFGTDA